MGLFDKFKKNSKNVKKENEKINTSSGNLFDEKPKDALTNNMNFLFSIFKFKFIGWH